MMQDDSDELSDSLRTGSKSEIGQEAGICTRTVSFTGRDAANYTTILMQMDPLVGLAPTNSGLQNHSCSC